MHSSYVQHLSRLLSSYLFQNVILILENVSTDKPA